MRTDNEADQEKDIDGIPLRMVENTAAPAARTPFAHAGSSPRFLLNKDIHL